MNIIPTFGNLSFDEDFLNGHFADGTSVSFTKTESGLLKYMTANPNRVLTRNQLLDAISDNGADKLDRSIDFVINRLRRKLKDDAKDATYIATRYGEGYIWLTQPDQPTIQLEGVHAIVGPCLGLDHVGDMGANALAFAKAFHGSFAKCFSSDLSVIFEPDCPKYATLGKDAPKIGIELSFLTQKGQLECVIRGVSILSGRTLFAGRHIIAATDESLSSRPEDLAKEASDQIWNSQALEPDDAVPLTVSMINAGTTFTGLKGHWKDNDKVLRKAIADDPDDPRAKIMLATNIHTKYLQEGVEIFMSGDDPRQQDEDEIEQLVLASLPHLNDAPSFQLVAAKLLFFLDRGYNEMAVEIAERSARECLSLMASLPIIGQMWIFVGQNEEGLAAINQALDECEESSQFEIYLLILKCEALAAVADRKGVRSVLNRVCANVPHIEVLMEVLFTDPDHPSKVAQQALVNMAPAQARAMLLFMHYVYARLLKVEEHRHNAYRTVVTLFRKQFGPDIVPDEVKPMIEPA